MKKAEYNNILLNAAYRQALFVSNQLAAI